MGIFRALSLRRLVALVVIAAACGWAAARTASAAAPPEAVRWQRVAPGYGAWTVDQRSPGGPLVFAGGPDTLEGIFATQDCQSVGCAAYRLSGGQVERLFGEGRGFGIMDVALGDGVIGAAAIDTDPGVRRQGHLWAVGPGARRVPRAVPQQAFAVTRLRDGRLVAAAGRGRLYVLGRDGAWRARRPGPTCSFYALDAGGPRLLAAGFTGTYAVDRRWRARRIGPASDAVWSSRDGRTLVVDPLAQSRSLLLSRDGGRHWRRQALVDGVGRGPCENRSGNASGDCSDAAPGARLGIAAIAGSGPGDLWAAGGRADIPGGRVYRYAGGDRWERVPFPADIWWASDLVVPAPGQPVVAGMEGIYRAAPGGGG